LKTQPDYCENKTKPEFMIYLSANREFPTQSTIGEGKTHAPIFLPFYQANPTTTGSRR